MVYCKKDGDHWETGTPPMSKDQKGKLGGEAQQKRWRDVRLAAQEGRLDDIPEDIRFQQDQCIDRHRQRYKRARKLSDTEETHLWYWGASGTGKSRKAREENPDACLKLCNKG